MQIRRRTCKKDSIYRKKILLSFCLTITCRSFSQIDGRSVLLLNKNLPGNKVINHHDRRGEDLHQHVGAAHVLIQDACSGPHDQGVDPEADDAQDQENRKLLRFIGVSVRVENKGNAQDVVHHHGNGKGNAAGNGGVDAAKLGQGDHDAVVDEERQKSHQTEPDDLFQ